VIDAFFGCFGSGCWMLSYACAAIYGNCSGKRQISIIHYLSSILSRTARRHDQEKQMRSKGRPAAASEMLVLGIETSCDKTAAAVVLRDASGRGRILSNVVRSQMD